MGQSLVQTPFLQLPIHCLYCVKTQAWRNKSQIRVIKSDFSSSLWREQADRFTCQNYKIPKLCNTKSGLIDLAVIKLNKIFDTYDGKTAIIQPCPFSEGYREGMLIGMGLITLNPNPEVASKVLMETVLYRLYSCATFYKLHGKEIENQQVCYGGRTAIPTGKAGGNSGGPILHAASSGKDMYVIGALIEEPQHIPSVLPYVFTRADYFAKWITNSFWPHPSIDQQIHCLPLV